MKYFSGVLYRLLCTIDLTWLYSFLLYYQTSSSRRSSLSSLPQPLLNAVRPKQGSLEPFPVTWAQKVAFNCFPSPTKRPSESRQRVVSSSSASSLQSQPNNNPWCASAGFQLRPIILWSYAVPLTVKQILHQTILFGPADWMLTSFFFRFY